MLPRDSRCVLLPVRPRLRRARVRSARLGLRREGHLEEAGERASSRRSRLDEDTFWHYREGEGTVNSQTVNLTAKILHAFCTCFLK